MESNVRLHGFNNNSILTQVCQNCTSMVALVIWESVLDLDHTWFLWKRLEISSGYCVPMLHALLICNHAILVAWIWRWFTFKTDYWFGDKYEYWMVSAYLSETLLIFLCSSTINVVMEYTDILPMKHFIRRF